LVVIGLDGPTGVVDDSPGRIMLVGWNYGPRAIQLFQTDTGEPIGSPVGPNEPIWIPGTSVRSISAELVSDEDEG
jgi:hypothetical protein